MTEETVKDINLLKLTIYKKLKKEEEQRLAEEKEKARKAAAAAAKSDVANGADSEQAPQA